VFSRVLGEEVVHNSVSRDEYASLGFPGSCVYVCLYCIVCMCIMVVRMSMLTSCLYLCVL
jgi:hypothetical protein